MTLSRTRLFASTTAAALLASSALAVAADAPRLAGDADLVRISGGAQLRYDLTKATSKQTVTIAGKTARIKRFDQDGDRVYVATVHKGGLKAGKAYRVVLKVQGKTLLAKSLKLQDGR